MRYLNINGSNWIELRGTVSLDQAALSAQETAAQLAVSVDLAIREIVLSSVAHPPAIARKHRA